MSDVFGQVIAELLWGLVEFGALAPGREDAQHIQRFPRNREQAGALIAALPERVGTLGSVPRSDLEVWYRGSAGNAAVRAIDVTELGFERVGTFLVEVMEQAGDAVEEYDLDGELLYVATTEEAQQEGFIGSWGLADETWVLVTTADSPETRSEVTRAVVRTLASHQEPG